jgi:poly(A) polymerase
MDCTSSHGDLTLYNFAKERVLATPPDEMRPTPLVTGDDLITAGYLPGPRFKEILGAVEDGQLEGRLHSREQAMQFIAENFPATNNRV